MTVGHDDRIDSYLECLEQEARHYRGMTIETLYLGGGTPGYLTLEQLRKLFVIIRKNFQLTSDCEVTLEANPEGLHPDKAKLLRDLGVNRISLGIQTTNDKYLKYLGRCHDARTAVSAFENLRKAGFENINLDLMYSFPGQTDQEIRDDVRALVSLDSEHVSLYTLTIEEPSKFFVSQMTLDNDKKLARQYELVSELLNQTEFRQYEISNFAKPGRESEHNFNYWEIGSYIGLGVAAHSHMNGERCWNVLRTDLYISKVKNGESPRAGSEKLSADQQLMEMILFGLRMNKGVDLTGAQKRAGCCLEPQKEIKINELIDAGFLLKDSGRLKAAPQGRLILDEICGRLI